MTSTAAMSFDTSLTSRGYTGHEMIDSVGLVHMNGRVYDAELGRFLSADPFVQFPDNIQSWNRYAYVLNNPLSFTDPSGFFLSGLFKAIGNFFSSAFRAIGNVLKKALANPIIRTAIQIVGCAITSAASLGSGCAAITVALAGAGAWAVGGSLADAAKAVAISVASMGVFDAVGTQLTALAQTLQAAGDVGVAAYTAAKSAVHGVIGGGLAELQGGRFVDGFAAGAVGAAAGVLGNAAFGNVNGPAGIALRTAVAAAAGCGGALLSGGKCGNGAASAATAHLFNFEGLGRFLVKAALTTVGTALGAAAAPLAAVVGTVGSADPVADATCEGTGACDENRQFVVRAGIGKAPHFENGTKLGQNGFGFSVQTSPGVPWEELARGGQFPNGQVSVTTLDAILSVPGVVGVNFPTPGAGAYHGTVVIQNPPPPGTFEGVSAVFRQFPNPSPVPRN